MYMTTNSAPATARITQIITDHTGSLALSRGLNNKFTTYYHYLLKGLIDKPSYLLID